MPSPTLGSRSPEPPTSPTSPSSSPPSSASTGAGSSECRCGADPPAPPPPPPRYSILHRRSPYPWDSQLVLKRTHRASWRGLTPMRCRLPAPARPPQDPAAWHRPSTDPLVAVKVSGFHPRLVPRQISVRALLRS